MFLYKTLSDFKNITSILFKTNIISKFSYVLIVDKNKFD